MMFEKCGLRDILYRIWKNKVWICLVMVLALALGAVAGMHHTTEQKKELWNVSASYLVELNQPVAPTQGETETAERTMAFSALAILTSDYTRSQVYHELTEKFSKEEIIHALSLDVTPEELSAFALENTLYYQVIGKSSIVNFYIRSENNEFAREYIQAYCRAFEQIPQKLENCKLKLIGSVDEQIQGASLEDQNGVNMALPVVGAILGLMVSLLVITAIAVFVPTVNRREDIAAYRVPVLGELQEGGKSGRYSVQVVAQHILSQCQKQNCTHVAVLTSGAKDGFVAAVCQKITEQAQQNDIQLYLDTQNVKGDAAVELTAVGNPNQDVRALRSCMQSDGVILIERYGVTRHKALEGMLEDLADQNIPVLGAIGYGR